MLNECGYEAIDKLVSSNDQDNFENLLTSNNFAWFISENDKTVDEDEYKIRKLKFPNIRESVQLSHTFCYPVDNNKTEINSDKYDDTIKLFNNVMAHFKLNNLEVFRIKANLQMQCESNKLEHHNTPHIDVSTIKHYVAIYYVNDSDGKTILFNKDNTVKIKVSPKKGRFLVFDGSILHTGSHPIKNKKRMVVNYNFYRASKKLKVVV